MTDAALRAFGDLVHAAEPDIDLGLAAFAIARIEHRELSPEDEMARLDALASRSGVSRVADDLHALHRLREFLFEEEGLRGNAEDYYDPRNSCLNDVLDRKLGIPISLSVVMMEVGRRVGLRIAGICLPGHFVVSAHVGADRVLLDPFDGGTIMTLERAAHVVSRALGRPVELTDADLVPCGKRQILIRMLNNLKGVYCRREAWEKALAVVDRLLLLDATGGGHVRDRGTLLVRLGHLHHGAAEWERYLARRPEAEDAEALRRQLRRIRQGLAALN